MNTTDWKIRVQEKEKAVYLTARKLLENEAKKRISRLYLGLGNKVYLDSVEENIVLWRYTYDCLHDGSTKYVFFYTDLDGEPLFNGKLFRYATPFSQGKALVFDFDSTGRPYIIDIQSKELIIIPKDLGWRSISNFKNNRLSLEDHNKKWGSLIINKDERVIELEIPFIWDYLASSKEKDIVYPGKLFEYTVYPNYESGPYGHMVKDKDKSVDYECIKLSRMVVTEALTLKRFKELESFITEMEWRNAGLTRYMFSFLENPGDEYFSESIKENLCTTDGSIVDLGIIDDYKGVAYKLKK